MQLPAITAPYRTQLPCFSQTQTASLVFCVVIKGQAKCSPSAAAALMLSPPAVSTQLQPQQPAAPSTGAAATRLRDKRPPITDAQQKEVENCFKKQMTQQQDKRFDWKKTCRRVGVPA